MKWAAFLALVVRMRECQRLYYNAEEHDLGFGRAMEAVEFEVDRAIQDLQRRSSLGESTALREACQAIVDLDKAPFGPDSFKLALGEARAKARAALAAEGVRK